MQAPVNLSPQQRSALESSYTFLSGVVPFLGGLKSQLESDDDKLAAENLLELAYLCQKKLLESFPELLEWLTEWERGVGNDQAPGRGTGEKALRGVES